MARIMHQHNNISSSYITKGRAYKVLKSWFDGNGGLAACEFKDDEGDTIFTAIYGSAHLDDQDWQVVGN